MYDLRVVTTTNCRLGMAEEYAVKWVESGVVEGSRMRTIVVARKRKREPQKRRAMTKMQGAFSPLFGLAATLARSDNGEPMIRDV